MNGLPLTLQDYAASRDALLVRLVEDLKADRRIAAAWLEGSFGRNEADQVSDLDLHLAIEDACAEALCFHPRSRNAGTAPERLALISTFGRPALIHENHHNAPPGGSFSFVLYSTSAVMVDWILAPLAAAARPPESRLLFEKKPIPIRAIELPQAEEPPSQDVAERMAFFWMMAAVCCKYIARGEDETVAWFYTVLQNTLVETDRLVHPDSSRSDKNPRPVLPETLLELCRQMNGLAQEAHQAPAPLDEINTLLNLDHF